uniref:Uncharacterized protein n=1 Tax=Triticum aestivum TaxID=4565 RepID=A0A3B6FN78_WHEAT
MPRSRVNGNFIDKTSSINYWSYRFPLALIEFIGVKKNLLWEGNYAEALQNYYEATRLEIDPYDRSYILYNIGLIHTSNGEHTKALEYYFRALERNPFLPQAFNNMAVICHYAILEGDSEIAEAWFDQAAEYWKQAIALTPGNYIEAQNWLKITKRFEFE